MEAELRAAAKARQPLPALAVDEHPDGRVPVALGGFELADGGLSLAAGALQPVSEPLELADLLDEADALLAGSDHYLVEATPPPGDPKTLVARTVDHLWQLRDVCDEPANLEPGKTFADILDSRVPGVAAGEHWRRLQEEAESQHGHDGQATA